MEFQEFNQVLQNNFNKLVEKSNSYLYEVNVERDELWELYLKSFPKGTNEIYRERSEYDCNCCKRFVRQFGHVVFIIDGKMKNIWEFKVEDEKFQTVIDALAKHVSKKEICNIHPTQENKIGNKSTLEFTPEGNIHEWFHFYLDLNGVKRFDRSRSEGNIRGEYNGLKEVFENSLEKISKEAIESVLELIKSNTLYKGSEWKNQLTQFLTYKKEYTKLKTKKAKNIYLWNTITGGNQVVYSIKNTSIGTLLLDISDGDDLDKAVTSYEKITAPENYKRPKAIFTQKMLDDAKKVIQELGYMDSLGRRYAKLDDIRVNNILFSNRDAAKRMGLDVFDEMSSDLGTDVKKFSKVDEISINDFINNVLPDAKEIEVLFENKHINNMVSLIAPENKDSLPMFKWDNGFSWAYTGNITDSSLKENVKSAGGKVDGVLRFSIQWNDIEKDLNDLDAHCRIERPRDEIYYANKNNRPSLGNLDVDIIRPTPNVPAVENITWPLKEKLYETDHYFFVRCFSNNGGKSGFRAEIEFDGEIHSYEYNKPLRGNEDVAVASVKYSKKDGFSIKELIPSTVSSRETWNIKTNQFIPVSVVMYSPNYWDEQKGIGNQHCFFMLKDCINPEEPNGFYNEFLKQDLITHKRVFEALGGKMHVKEVDDQLSGIGFSLTKRNEVTVKVIGNTERVMKVKF